MQTFKTSDAKFTVINTELAEGKKQQAAGEKRVKAAKDAVRNWLKAERSFDIDAQPIGSVVVIQLDGKDCISLRVTGRNQFDLDRFRTERAELVETYTKLSPTVFFDAL